MLGYVRRTRILISHEISCLPSWPHRFLYMACTDRCVWGFSQNDLVLVFSGCFRVVLSCFFAYNISRKHSQMDAGMNLAFTSPMEEFSLHVFNHNHSRALANNKESTSIICHTHTKCTIDITTAASKIAPPLPPLLLQYCCCTAAVVENGIFQTYTF